MPIARLALITLGVLSCLATAHGQSLFRDRWGHFTPIPFMHRGWTRVVHPGGRMDPRIDPKLQTAAAIAQARAFPHSHGMCWRYVKEALVAAGAVKSYPKTSYAIDAGNELVRDYGFSRLSVHNPYAAPLGAVLVYGDLRRGHVEIRTKDGFASDYHSNNACFYRLVGVYAKS